MMEASSSPFADAPLFLAGGGTSSSVWACAVQNSTADTPIDCFLPSDSYSNDGVIPTTGVLDSNGAAYSQIFMAGGGSSSSVWGCALSQEQKQIDCFLPSDSYATDGVIPVKGRVLGGYKNIFMAGDSFSTSVWACAVPEDDGGQIDCFLPTDSYSSNNGLIPIRGSVRGGAPGTYSNLFMAGGNSNSVWGCAVKAIGGIDCFLPNDSYSHQDGIIPVKGTLSGVAGEYSNLFMAGSSSSSVWGCAVKTTGGIDCFLPNDSYSNDGEIPVKGTLSGVAGEYSNLFMAGGGSSRVWGCAVKVTGGIDCFLPIDSYSNDGKIPVTGTLPAVAGEYSNLFMAGGGSSSSVWGCAVKTTGGIDCFLPSDAYGNDGVIPVKGSVLGAAGEYSNLFMAGGGTSSSVWGCAARSSGDGADCFLPSDAYSAQDGVIPIKGTFLFPTPTPSLQPTISLQPSHSPSSQPSVHPTISRSPTNPPEPTMNPTPAATASSIGTICSVVLVGVITISLHFY